MPYNWTSSPSDSAVQELRIWPHQSLPPKGMAAVILGIFTLALVPLLTMLGSILLWGILPFILLAVAGTWVALSRNHKDLQILEILTLTAEDAHLVRHNPGGDQQDWHCNRYWVRPEMHKHGGPVPYYVTLKGSGREVEIGAFLSEDERKDLYQDLLRAFKNGLAA